jgi:hypothetical protein
MDLFAISIAPLEIIPDGLTPRFQSGNLVIGAILFAAFVAVTFVRVSRSGAYASLVVANGKLQGMQSFVKESMPLNKSSSILLLVNYLLSSSAMLYLYALHLENTGEMTWWIVGLLPLILLLWNLGSLILSRWLIGEHDVFQEPILLKVIGAQLLGLIYFAVALVWLLNSGHDQMFPQIMIWAYLAESGFRIVKSILLVSRRGVPWYYIIMYFCTLEILPLFIAYSAVGGNFNK